MFSALLFIISTGLSDELFRDVLASYQATTNVSGMLGLTTLRDAFFTSPAKLRTPSMSTGEPPTPRTTQSLTDNLGFTGPLLPLDCQSDSTCPVFISRTLYLSREGDLDGSWFDILEALQNVD